MGLASPGRGGAVLVRTLDGCCFSVAPEDGWRIRHLKSHLQAELGVLASELELLSSGRVLGNSEPVPRAAGSGGPEGGGATEEALHGPPELTLVRTQRPRLPAFLLRKGLASINDVAPDGSTALHLAASQGDALLCQELLVASDFLVVSARDFLGNSALHLAAERGLPAVCAALLAHPGFAPAAAANRNGRTALHLAALRGDEGTCRAVLAHRLVGEAAALEAKDALGCTAADLAASVGHDALAQELRGTAHG